MNRVFAFTVILTICFQALPLLAQGQPPEYVRFFDPAKGFKPAQANLTDVFLQAAGSLECYGSPEPYLRHVQAEHVRISAKYKAATGHDLKGRWPSYMTDEYIDTLIANWNALSPKLHLENLAKDAGLCTREAIRGTRDTGTILVGIFDKHQKRVVDAMHSGKQAVGFDELASTLHAELEYDKPDVDTRGYEIARRDAVSYALIFDGTLAKLHRRMDAAIEPQKSSELKAAITSAFLDLGRMAHTEMEFGFAEASLR